MTIYPQEVPVSEDDREKKPSTICRHCDRDREVHADDGKCFFEASSFVPYTMGEIVDKTIAAFPEQWNKHTHATTPGPTSPLKSV